MDKRRRTLTVDDILSELGIARSTWNDWRAKGRAPRCIKLPNGKLRVLVQDYQQWLSALEVAA